MRRGDAARGLTQQLPAGAVAGAAIGPDASNLRLAAPDTAASAASASYAGGFFLVSHAGLRPTAGACLTSAALELARTLRRGWGSTLCWTGRTGAQTGPSRLRTWLVASAFSRCPG
jgi:hypothetical protein